MTQSFKLPDLGEGIHEGEVTAVTVSVGDSVQEGDVILEIETDKAAVEIPSPITGTVAEILVNPGDVVNVGDVLMIFDTGEASESVIKEDDEKQGVEAPDGSKVREPPVDQAPPGASRKQPVPASPATRRLARELGVDLHDVTPTGRGGVVMSDDVRMFAEKGGAETPSAPGGAAASRAAEAAEKAPGKPGEKATGRADDTTPPRPLTADAPALPDFTRWGDVERVPVRSIRRATARQMALAWSRIPHVTTIDKVDITDLEAFRQKHKKKIVEAGGRLTLTVFVLKAVVAALKQYPYFNASLDAAAGELILKRYYHLGVAVDADDGLIVPVIRDVDRKSLTDLAVELKALVQKTHDRKIGVEDLQGGTFTITNTGSAGGALFVPIINTPQAAILGMGRASLEPVVRTLPSGRHEIVPRFMMPIILTMDHRILDGGDASRFLTVVTGALADPEQLMLTMA
jgi:pyruvate dehydrogenase E2 component (dihydrolipoamide acetyltransferase)